ncbi:hypothetical protein [Streptomyces otsuchiensis]|uniref:hypothetical protein n=1 Tax=Streptomyces otsuchiensis TaxID=2681388 RepID=UPI0027D9BC9F|nr:hypothetical protein [Streptomyces otsuchiensis]
MRAMAHARHRTRGAARLLTVLGLSGALLLGGAAGAVAQDEDDATGDAATPTEAGSGFRTAAVLGESGEGTARATVGEFLYWAFPVAAGHDATATATVTFEDDGARSGPTVWQLDLYDGLRRRQACVGGDATVEAPAAAGEISLSCTLRTVRSWADPWSTDPLPGAYYLRLTAVSLPEEDLGLPVSVAIRAETEDAGGAHAYGGDLGAPLVPTPRAGSLDTGGGDDGQDGEDGDPASDPETGDDGDDAAQDELRFAGVVSEPEGGWNGGWWSDRWLWTAGGGVLGAFAALGGYALVRHPRSRG